MTLQQVTSGILFSECSLIGSGVWYRERDGAPVYSPHELETHYRMHKCKICIWGLNRRIMYCTPLIHSLTGQTPRTPRYSAASQIFFLLPPHQQKAGMSWSNWAGRPGGGGVGGNTASSLPSLSVRHRVFSPISPNHSVKLKKTVTSMHTCTKNTLTRPEML